MSAAPASLILPQTASSQAAPLRVLELATMFGMGGISRHVLALGAWLRTQGHQVSYAGTAGPWLDETKDSAFLPLDIHGASGDRDGAGMAGRLKSLASSAGALRRWLRANPVDLIHAHESAPALVAKIATMGRHIPIVLTYHGAHASRVAQFASVARRMDRVISVSHRSGEDLVAGGLPRQKLRVIGLGLASPPTLDAARVEQLRKRLLNDGDRLVVTLARLTVQKGVDVLIQVAREVVAQNPRIRFAVVGDGPLMAEAEADIRAYGLEGKVHLLGRSEEPHLHLAAADIFLLTSRWEALPFTIAEAFQMGLPAIATDCGGVKELIDNTVGRVLPVEDVGGLARAVLDIAGNDPLRKSMAASSLARSRQDRFALDYNHQQIEQLYRDVASAASRKQGR